MHRSSGINLEFLGLVEILVGFAARFYSYLLPLCATVLKYGTDAQGMMSGSLSMFF